jgi:prepilin-type N-terminal cleavage/methylation domain-containing protein
MREGGPHTHDGGFSLIEVVVAMAVFAVLASISLGILLNTADVSGDSIRRTAATNLVNTQLETARSLTAQNIPDGLVVTKPKVNGFEYIVEQTASYVASSASASVCSGTGSSLAYKLVTVVVSWPNMGSIKPVRGDTLRAVGVGKDGLDATKGTLALAVVGSTSQPTPKVVVTLMPGNIVRTTGDDGCAIYTGLAPGTYTASSDMTGYVGSANKQLGSVGSGISITAGTVSRASLLYDLERTVGVIFNGPAGAIVPSNLVLRAGDSYVPEVTLPICLVGAASACITAVPGTVSNLFPESYTFKAGTCSESSASQSVADLRPVSTNGSVVTVPMGAATVKVVRTAAPTIGIPGRTVSFTHAGNGGCPSGELYTTSSVVAGSTMLVPYGLWTISAPIFNASGATVGVSSQTFTFGTSTPTASIVVEVAL